MTWSLIGLHTLLLPQMLHQSRNLHLTARLPKSDMLSRGGESTRHTSFLIPSRPDDSIPEDDFVFVFPWEMGGPRFALNSGEALRTLAFRPHRGIGVFFT